MSELTKIIESATDSDVPLVTVLRQCLVLAAKLKNEDLRRWVLSELNGYESREGLPPYRVMHVHSKGHLVAGFGAQITNQSLPSSNLDEAHRHWADTAHLTEGISAYETTLKNSDSGSVMMPWPPDLVARYQSSFIRGYTLMSAWIDIPIGALTAMVDAVRTRVLEFALDLQTASEDQSSPVEKLSREQVQKSFVTNIYGGNNVLAQGNEGEIRQVGSITVGQGDFAALTKALKAAGVSEQKIEELKGAIDEDRSETGHLTIGRRVGNWLQNVSAGVAGGVATNAATPAVLAFFGIPTP